MVWDDDELDNIDDFALDTDSDASEDVDAIVIDPPSISVSAPLLEPIIKRFDPLLAAAFQTEYYGVHNSRFHSRFGAVKTPSTESHPWLCLPEMANQVLLSCSEGSQADHTVRRRQNAKEATKHRARASRDRPQTTT